ncbi:MAG: low molecular weight phosphatase family protein [Caulobacteraceae bacterium]|nr:low molecular weight phosphatase family protein [Caulobacter sp.]
MDTPAPSPRPAAVLFVCTWNRVRSPMAAALVRRRWGALVWADSCGVHAGEGAPDPFAEAVLSELGAGLCGHAPKRFADLLDGSFDLVAALSPEALPAAEAYARGRAAEVAYWPTQDPTLETGARELRLAAYRAVRDELDRRLIARLGAPAPAAP